MPRTWPLVGRSAERAFIADAITRRETAGLVLAGDPGVGKSRLALETVKDAEDQGFATAWILATRASASIPFGPMAHLLPDGPSPTGGPLDLLRGITDKLVTRARGGRLLIGVDDAHLLDAASATLVHQLAATGRAFVLLTLRTGEAVPDPITALWKEGVAERLEVQALSEAQTGELVAHVLGGHVDGPTMARLWEATRGNVLFLRELILAGMDSGALAEAGGVWSWTGPMAVSARLQEVIATRIGNLNPDLAALMEVLAVAESAPARLLDSLVSPAALEAAERRGMVVVDRQGRRVFVRLSHPLYGEAARARCPAVRARAIHRQLAAALEGTGARRRDDLLRLVTSRLEAGDAGPPQLLVAGARRALGAFDPVLGERLARAAADAGGGAPAHLVLAESLFRQGRPGEEEALVRLDERAAVQSERTATAILRALGVLWISMGRPSEAEEVLLRAEADVQDADLRDELKAVRGLVLFFSGQPGKAVAAVSGILERPDASERARVRAAMTAVPAWAVSGRLDQAVAIAERWTGPAARLSDQFPTARYQLLVAEGYALCLAGRLDEAEALAAKEYQASLHHHAHDTTGEWALLLGRVALSRGRVGTAARWLREAAALFRAPSGVNFLAACLTGLAHAAALAGDQAAAEAALGEAEQLLTPGMALFEPEMALARAWIAVARGEASKARSIALDAANRAEESGQYAIAVVALHDVARLGDAGAVAARLGRLASTVDGPLAATCRAHVQALLVRDAHRLDQAAESFVAMGAELLAAEAYAGAAAAHRAEGRKGPMLAASARAHRFFEACEGARTPALSSPVAVPLTPREREVATLAGGGFTSVEIARRLVLSVRTVETHLQRAYAKLGVGSRAELASVLGLLHEPSHGSTPPT